MMSLDVELFYSQGKTSSLIMSVSGNNPVPESAMTNPSAKEVVEKIASL
jgi:hypothetical protein